jgi:catechol-2,3-dioxygenase
VELIARERAPGEDLFLEISEVGLPVADVGVAVEWLESELGLPHFSGNRRDFSAVGDDRGLFIVVPVGRPWLFTDEPAPDVPLRVTIEPGHGAELVVPGSGHVVRS